MSRDFINNWQQSTQRHSDRKCYELFASSSHSLSCANLKIKMLYLTIWGSFPQRKHCSEANYGFLNNEERTQGLIFLLNDK